MKIWIVDAFTDRPYAGNPAAVTLVDEFPDDATCLKIAAEMNLSETAFVKKLGASHFHIRWFCPTVEVKLCGHATLAAAHVLYQEKLVSGDVILLESMSGQLKVYFSAQTYTLDFPLARTEAAFKVPIKCNFGVVVEAARVDDDVVVELPNEDQVRKYVPQYDELKKIDCRGVVITSKGTGDYDFVSRFFPPSLGVIEDPVCGSAHCKLALYWQKRLNKADFLAYQASSRGAELRVSIVCDRVHLSGKAVTVFSGEWHVPF